MKILKIGIPKAYTKAPQATPMIISCTRHHFSTCLQPIQLAGAVILADKGRANLSEGVDDEKDKNFYVERRRRGGHDVGTQAVDRRLDAQIRQGEDHALHACRQANAQHGHEYPLIYVEILQMDADIRRATAQEIKEQSRADRAGNDRADGHAFDRHAEDEDKKEIQKEFNYTGNDQAVQGRPRISLAAENRRLEVYSRMTGMPKRKIRRYSTDMSKISSGTDKARSRGAAAISPESS